MFHVNEIYFDHMVTFIKVIKNCPGTMQSKAVLNYIKYNFQNFSKLDNPNIEILVPRDQLDISVTRIAEVHLKAKLDCFFNKAKRNRRS